MLRISFASSHLIGVAAVMLACLLPSLLHAQSYGPNLLPTGNFENVRPTYIPWAGVDDNGNIHGIDGHQLAVGDDGSIRGSTFGPSVAVADLNGDGKPDLVLADSYGFFWFFPNSGTPQQPVFTQGEIMPIWLGEERVMWNTEGVDNVVPRIQLVDFDNNQRLDILAGTYTGKLFRIRNTGSSSKLDFRPTYDRDSMLINTHKKGVLWCNDLAPCLTSLFGSQNVLDLVMGEGTYSANSLWLLRNTNSSSDPSFNEDHLEKIIPGMGLEQLTPAVVDWNNDGKPDIICGDRTGFLNLYLNNSTDPDHPTFAPGIHVKIAGVEKLGNSITVAIGDLSGNHLPNLLIGRDDGTILYAKNTGKLGAPSFNLPAQPLKGVLPPGYRYVAPRDWYKQGAYGAPNELVACVNPKLEPGFTFPDGENSKYALKFSVLPVKNIDFPERFYPKIEDNLREHVVQCGQRLNLKLNKRYRVHFWVKADGPLSDLRYKFFAGEPINPKGFNGYDVINPVDVGPTWTEVSSEIRIENPDDPTITTWNYGFEFRFTGQPTFYIDDVQIQEVLE
jgi:FG-GAP repeat protein/VCBS repeat protein